MKTIKSYILERLVLSKTKSKHYISLFEFAKLFFPEINHNEKDYFSEDSICDHWLLPYEINGDHQDTNPDNWEEGDIRDICRVLDDNINTEIDIDIQENKPLDAWDYYFELEWKKSIYKFCWVSRDDLRNKI